MFHTILLLLCFVLWLPLFIPTLVVVLHCIFMVAMHNALYEAVSIGRTAVVVPIVVCQVCTFCVSLIDVFLHLLHALHATVAYFDIFIKFFLRLKIFVKMLSKQP